ncbi:MAG: GNAT family N-acetyltransferase [Planctomycetota bacterium]
MSKYEIRPYRPGDEQGILQLFNIVFGEGDPAFVPRTLAQWRWEYAENPAGLHVTIAVDPRGDVVAQYACLPYFAQLGGERVVAHQGVDSIAHPEHRRGLKKEGVFLATAKAFFAQWGRPDRVAFGFGFPNKKVYRLGLRQLDYVPVAAPVPTLHRNLFQKPDDDEVGGAELADQVIELAACDAAVDALWRRCQPDHQLALIRDAAYLRWRYLQCPYGPYRIHALPGADGSLRGLIATRQDWMGPPIFAIADWLVPAADEAALARLLRFAVARARAAGQQRVETWMPASSPHRRAILARGFGEEPCHYNLCVKMYRPSLTLEWMKQHWYYTIGDADVF